MDAKRFKPNAVSALDCAQLDSNDWRDIIFVHVPRSAWFPEANMRFVHNPRNMPGNPPQEAASFKTIKRMFKNGTDEQASVCSHYLDWLYGPDAASHGVKSIDLYESAGVLYLFPSDFKMLDSVPVDINGSVLEFLTPADLVKSRAVRPGGLGTPSACPQIRVNVLDPDIEGQLDRWARQCMTGRVFLRDQNRTVDAVGKIGKIVCVGPLAGQTPPEQVRGMSAECVSSICRMTSELHIPMVFVSQLRDVVQRMSSFGDLKIHVQEVELDVPNLNGSVLMYAHLKKLVVDRWVVRDVRQVGEESLQRLRGILPNAQIYALVARDSDEAARPTGVDKYIAQEGANVRGATVLYREFYEDLRCKPGNMYEAFSEFYPFAC
jgi:hypothetical protein